MRSAIATLSTALFLSACGSSAGTPAAQSASSISQRPVSSGASSAGLDGVIGLGASSLMRRFGEARIDLTEGEARKLQFTSDRCVLDVFLYPEKANTEPVAAHVEARERQGGAQTDRRRCIRDVAQSARAR